MENEIYYSELVREYTIGYFSSLKNKTKMKLFKPRIIPSMYKKALQDYMVFGRVTRFPEKHILNWKSWIVNNIAILEAFTAIGGHSTHFPYDELNDTFFYNQDTGELDREIYDYTEATQLMEKYDLEDKNFPTWSNGQWLLSDFAMDPLLIRCYELIELEDPTQILLCIDKILNVIHQRSDVAELFMVGGSEKLTQISN